MLTSTFDRLKAEQLLNPQAIEPKKSLHIRDIEFHDIAPEYPRSSNQGVLHIVRRGESSALVNCQYSLRSTTQADIICPELEMRCRQYTYICKGVYMCKYATAEMKDSYHYNEADWKCKQTGIPPSRILLDFLVAAAHTSCRHGCAPDGRIVTAEHIRCDIADGNQTISLHSIIIINSFDFLLLQILVISK